VTTNGTLSTNEQEHASVKQMPALVRQLHVEMVTTEDATRSGIPDLLESCRQTAGSLSSFSMAIGTARTDSTRAWLFLAAVVMALWLLASFELGR